MTVEISQPEANLLRTLLTEFIEETRSEIHHTDADSYKEGLKQKEQEARNLLEKLPK